MESAILILKVLMAKKLKNVILMFSAFRKKKNERHYKKQIILVVRPFASFKKEKKLK